MRTIEEIKAEIEFLVKRKPGNMHEEIYRCQIELLQVITRNITLDRLEEICQAEREGRLVVLPRKVGDTVYSLAWVKATEYFRAHADDTGNLIPDDVDLSDDEYGVVEDVFCVSDYDELGRTVFLTREEAEAALEGAKHE